MKTSIFTVVLLLALTLPVFPQNKANEESEQSLKRKDVPKTILAAFEQSYPKAKVQGYSKETDKGKTVYEIESKEGKTARDVSYNEDGSLVSVEESIQYSELPETVRGAIAKEYPKHKAVICEKIMKGTTTEFEVLLKSGKQKIEVVYNPDGSVVEKETK